MPSRSILKETVPLKKSDCFSVFTRHKTAFDFPVHYHEEYELNFIENAKGVKRIVGDSVEEIEDPELVSVYQFRLLFTGTQNAFNYGSPNPDMMYRANVSIPGNAGIYRDSLVTGFFDRDSGWIASDGSFSIPLSDGRDLWAMNDSYINNFDTVAGTTPCLFQVRNAALVQPMNNWNWTATHTLIGNGPGIPSLFKNNSNDNYLLWPTGGYQHGDTVYVYNSNIMNFSGGLGFTSGGNDFPADSVSPCPSSTRVSISCLKLLPMAVCSVKAGSC